jgi:hypothetical protein
MLSSASRTSPKGRIGIQAVTTRMRQDLAARAARLGTSSGVDDTTWVGYTPGHQNNVEQLLVDLRRSRQGRLQASGERPARQGRVELGRARQGRLAPGLVAAAYGGDGVHRQRQRRRSPAHLPRHRQSGQLRHQRKPRSQLAESRQRVPRPGWRTLGVDGLWHRDGGSTQKAGPVPAPTWAPLEGHQVRMDGRSCARRRHRLRSAHGQSVQRGRSSSSIR